MAEAGDQDIDFTKLPIEERCTHKNWKARVSGYEALVKQFEAASFDEKAPCFNQYAPLMKKFVVDSNAAAQEKGMAAVLAFLQYSNIVTAGRTCADVVAGIITKCLISPKVKTKEAAAEIVFMYVEIEKHEIVLEELIKGLDNKSPKIVSGCVSLIRQSLQLYGSKVIAIKPIVKVISRLLEDRDKNVREEGKQLVIECYRWVKDALKPQLQSLKPVQITELEAEFEKVKDERPTPTRYLRSEQNRVVAQEEGGDDADGNVASQAAPVSEEVDPYELLDPVDILSKLPKDFEELCKAKKWQERKEALEKLEALITENPKLATGDYGTVVSILRDMIKKDANIVVVGLATKCLAGLAAGLRKGFKPYANSMVPVILEKFKEKKATVVQALRDAIDAVAVATTMEDMEESLVKYLNEKNPQQKTETALFMARSFANQSASCLSNKKLLKSLCVPLIANLNGAAEPFVRDASAEALGVAMKVVGEKVMNPLLADVDPLKVAKVKEYCEKAVVKAPLPAPVAPAPKGPPAVRRPPTTSSTKKPAPTVSAASSKSDLNDEDTRSSKSDESTTAKQPIKKTVLSGSRTVTRVRKPGPGSGIGRTAMSAARTPSSNDLGEGDCEEPKASGVSVNRSKTIVKGKRPSLSSASSLASGSSKKEGGDDIGGSIPLVPVNNAKAQRMKAEQKLEKLKWIFESPRKEFYEQLKEQMEEAGWNANLTLQCFHSDFKFHIKAIDSLSDYLSAGHVDALLANSDLIVKWIALRLYDTNPSVILKALDLMAQMFTAAKNQENWRMSDFEAHSFIPHLIKKFGDPKDAVRNKCHDIFVLLADPQLYSPAKLSESICEKGLESKNSRQRAVCLNELTYLIETYGLKILLPSPQEALKKVGKQIADRDNGVRNAALACMVQVFYLEGEKVYKYAGQMNEKDMSLLEERIKRAAKNRPPPKPLAPALAPPSSAPASVGLAQKRSPRAASEEPQVAEEMRYDQNERTPSPEERQGLRPIRRIATGGGTITKQRPRSMIVGNMSLQAAPPVRQQLDYEDQNEEEPMEEEDQYVEVYEQEQPQFNRISPPKHFSPSHQRSPIQPLSLAPNQSPKNHQTFTRSQRRSFANQSREVVDELLNLPTVQLPPRKSQVLTSPPRAAMEQLLKTSPKTETALSLIVAQLSGSDIKMAVESFAKLHEVIMKADKVEDILINKVDQIVTMCCLHFRFLSQQHLNDDNIEKRDVVRLFKAIASVLAALFKNKNLARRASRDVLKELMPHLISIIIDTRLTDLSDSLEGEGQNIVKSINVLATTVINASEPTNIMCALIRLLHECVGGTCGFMASTSVSSTKFIEMVMKSLWKLARQMEKIISELNIDLVFLDVHNFLKAFPQPFWKADPNRLDTPLRTVKTITYMIVEQIGERVFDHLTKIPNKDESELYPYLGRALKQIQSTTGAGASNAQKEENRIKANGVSNTNGTSGASGFNQQCNANSSPQRSDSSGSSMKQDPAAYEMNGNVPCTPPKLSKEDHKVFLEIMSRLGTDRTQDGLKELHVFLQDHPQFNVDPFLQNSSPVFQNFVRRGLEKLSQRDALDKNPLLNNARDEMIELLGQSKTPSIKQRVADREFTRFDALEKCGQASGTRGDFPKLPSPEQMTKENIMEWGKQVASSSGIKNFSVNTIADLEQKYPSSYRFTGERQHDTQTANQILEDSKKILENFQKNVSEIHYKH